MASIEAIRRLRVQATSEGTDQVAANLNKVADAQQRVSRTSDETARVTETSARRQISAAGAYDRLLRSVDESHRTQQRFAAGQTVIERAFQQGVIDTQQYARSLQMLADKYGLVSLAAQRQAVEAERAAAVQRRVNAITGVSGGSDNAARAADVVAYGKQLDDLRAKYNPLFAAGRQYKDTLAEINMAAKVGALSESERAVAVQQTKTAFVQQVGSIKNTSAATGEMTKQAGLASHELVNLSRQVQDVGTMLAMGASPMQVFTSQAAQVFDIFSSSKGTLTGFFAQLTSGAAAFATSSIGAFTAVGAVVAGGVAALVGYRNEQEKIQISLMGVGRASGTTAERLREVGRAAASWSGLSTSEATEFATALAATGRVAQENLLPATQNAKNLAKVLGTDLAGAAQAMGQALSGNLEPINARLGAFSVAMKEQITLLMAQGREAQAQVLINRQVAEATKAASDATGGWSRAWTVLGNAASEAWRAIGRGADQLIGTASLEDQYRGAVSELEKLIRKREELQKQDRSWMTSDQRERVNSVYRLPSGAAADDVNRKNLEVINDLIAKGEVNTRKLKDAMDAVKASSDAVKANMQSVADQSLRATLSPEIGARQALAVQTAGASALARDPQRQAALGMTQAQADEQLKRAKGVEEGYRTSAQRIAESFELANKATTAFSPKQRAELAQLETAARLRDDPSMSPEDKRAAAQQAYNTSLKQGNVALSKAARARALYAQQSVQSAQLEIDMIGKTIGQQAEMRANLQARQTLEQQASQSRTAFDEAEYKRLQLINAEYGKRMQAAAQAAVNDNIGFGRQTALLSQEDVAIAQQLRGIYPDVATALGSVEAQGIRTAEALHGISSTMSSTMTTGFADMIDGTKPVGQAFGDMSKAIIRALNEAIIKMMVVAPIMRGLQNLAGGFLGMPSAGTGLSLTGTGGLYADGGYTGPGGVHQPAGVVHRGEVVWSQRDVARAGGVAAVEAMRLGQRGYADGGAVVPFPTPASRGGGRQAVTVNVHNAPAGTAASSTVSQDGNGISIDVMLKDAVTGIVREDALKNGPISKAMAARQAGFNGG